MPSFTNSLNGLDPFVNMGCTVPFTATGVLVVHTDGHSLLEGWREQSGAQLWRFPLQPSDPTGEVDQKQVSFTLPDDHIDRDSSEWRTVMSTPSLLVAVLPHLTEINCPQPVVVTLTPI